MDRFHSQLHKNGHSSYTKIDIAVTQRRISSLIFIIPFSVPHTNLFGNCLMDLQGWTHQNLWQTLEEMTVIYADPGRNVFKKKKKREILEKEFGCLSQAPLWNASRSMNVTSLIAVASWWMKWWEWKNLPVWDTGPAFWEKAAHRYITDSTLPATQPDVWNRK